MARARPAAPMDRLVTTRTPMSASIAIFHVRRAKTRINRIARSVPRTSLTRFQALATACNRALEATTRQPPRSPAQLATLHALTAKATPKSALPATRKAIFPSYSTTIVSRSARKATPTWPVSAKSVSRLAPPAKTKSKIASRVTAQT